MPIPLFPLPNLVLFPGQVLPLYIFEERYRALLREVQDREQPFGIVRIMQRSRESALPLHERVSPVGTLAHLVQAETHQDGTSSIVVVGGERFRVREFDLSLPFLSAEIDLWPLEQPASEAGEIELRAGQVLAGMLRSWPEQGEQLRAHAPAEPLALASYAAAVLGAMTGGLASDRCNEALLASTLLGRLERLLAALPASQQLMN
ncbi:hypothetical protein SAMN04488058_10515 [Deinococcus reticulitermitis]|uniref:Lon N-terminal domain-containing protein n=1 Tax=Deinococcus reticulitermitis TaxID=856736 RepID=A0A1H6WYA9_9DEIO|nr:LON peptidase substrate-binding domain-containing protein [Deinococcus reticulitermitis]SEJ21829.1 hypothetical protein SAMN04488058_10515 [Deinococcus reticulitermitis]